MKMDSRRLTVILQGPLNEGSSNIARRAAQSVRRYLPEAQIIISTTDATHWFALEGVQWVEDDSASHFEDINGNLNNVNKLISTTANGLALAEREYCLKLRTDHVLCSDALLTHLGVELPGRLLGARIGISNLFLRNPVRLPYLFHLTDTLQFGRTEDLRQLWSTGLLDADFVHLEHGPRLNPIGTFQGFTSFRLLPEQAICLRFAQQKGLALDLKHISHSTFALFCAWEDLLLDNFEVHDWQKLGVVPPARFLSSPFCPKTVMTERDVRRLRARRSQGHRMVRYARLLLNQYVLCWFQRRWLVSTASLLLFSLSSGNAIAVRNLYRHLTGARRLPGTRPSSKSRLIRKLLIGAVLLSLALIIVGCDKSAMPRPTVGALYSARMPQQDELCPSEQSPAAVVAPSNAHRRHFKVSNVDSGFTRNRSEPDRDLEVSDIRYPGCGLIPFTYYVGSPQTTGSETHRLRWLQRSMPEPVVRWAAEHAGGWCAMAGVTF